MVMCVPMKAIGRKASWASVEDRTVKWLTDDLQ